MDPAGLGCVFWKGSTELPQHCMPGYPAPILTKSASLIAVCAHQELVEPVEPTELLKWIPVGHAQMLKRLNVHQSFPDRRVAFPTHSNATYLTHGTPDVVTVWIPLGECRFRSRALVDLKGSHTIGMTELYELMKGETDRPDDPHPIRQNSAQPSRRSGQCWLWADYHAGDAVVHTPLIVDALFDAARPVMRMSADGRFARVGDVTDPGWSLP